jgi:ferredoxin/flavodoxin
MTKAIIYVFSGTGNTRAAADFIAEALVRRGVETDVWEARVPLFKAPDPNGYDMALFGYPVYAYNSPRFFLRFVKTLPEVKGMQAFIFKTSGEPFRMNNVSSRALVRILRKKGFVPMLEHHLLMPYNIMFRYRDALAKQMYLHTKDMAEVVADGISAGAAQKFRDNPFAVLLMYILRVQWFGAWLNGPLIHVKKSFCTGCGLCVKVCPASNVKMSGGYPRFGSRCTMCMGCAFLCPKDAVRPGLLNAWRVNGPYQFKKLVLDETIPATYIDGNTKGYFRLFWPYYNRTYREIEEHRAFEHTKSE